MKEDFLHYVWKFQKFSTVDLVTVTGESVQVLKAGTHNHNSGPDFLCAQVIIDGQQWAGTVEIHLKSSHWYAHFHEKDANYDTVILHVVWEHDMDIRRGDESVIPTLEIRELVLQGTVERYRELFAVNLYEINCEPHFGSMDSLLLKNWLDRLFMERLEQKSEWIFDQLKACKNDWDAVLFQLLSKNFGLKVNGASFLSIAQSVAPGIIKKCRQDLSLLEALLFGQAGLLGASNMDAYYRDLQKGYAYLILKHNLVNDTVERPKFFRLRPPNFPTIRLSQLAVLWQKRSHLFSDIINAESLDELQGLFKVAASSYWDTHYNFTVTSGRRKKWLSEKFIDLLLINTVIPIKFCYAVHRGQDPSEEIMRLAQQIKGEKNTVVEVFYRLGDIDNCALESQALLQLRNEYCSKNRCLECMIGNEILKNQ